MKKLILLAVVTAVLTVSQSAFASEWTVGTTGGLSIASTNGEDADSLGADSRTGIAIGAFAQGKFNENFGLRIAVLYVQKGATDSFGSVDFTARLDYIEIPILAMTSIAAGESATINFFAGPSIAFNTKGELEASGRISPTVDIKDGIKTVDFGGVVGAGVDFDKGPVMLGVGVSYTFGFSSVDDGIAAIFDPSDTSTADIKNGVLLFLASIGFPIGAE